MSAAWFVGATHSVKQDESAVRSTLDTVRTDGPSESHEEPEWNEFDSDESAQLTGLTPRQMSGDVHESQQYVPSWLGLASMNREEIIDNQVASSGTAAARESAGQTGHGTAEYTQSIEPIVRDGAAFGNDYFVTNPLGAQEGAGNYMTPDPAQDLDWLAVAQAQGVRASREAYEATLYQTAFGG